MMSTEHHELRKILNESHATQHRFDEIGLLGRADTLIGSIREGWSELVPFGLVDPIPLD